MATLLPNGKQQFFDGNGTPLADGSVYFFIPQSSSPKDTYQNSAGTILNTNPVVLDSSGEAVIYGSGIYRQVIYDADGNLIWDQLTASTDSGAFAWGGVSTGTANVQAVSSSSFSSQDGQQLGFIAGYTNNAALTVNPGGSGAIPVLRDSPIGPTPLTGGEVVAANEITMVYEAARGAFHLTNPAIGTMASQNANAVAITGGTIAGVTISTSTVTAPTLTLKSSASPTPTTTGDIQYGTNQKTIVIGNGSGRDTFWAGVIPGALWGVTVSNNVSDATNDIDFAAGFCADYTNVSQVACAALTKQLDANWSPGTNQGMRYSGAAITNTTYHLYAAWTATGTQDYYADPSATPATALGHLQAETGGASYVYIRRVASIVRTGGSIKPFVQYNDQFLWVTPVRDINNGASGTSAVTATLSVPTGIIVTANVSASLEQNNPGAPGVFLLLTSLSVADTTPSSSAFTTYIAGANTGLLGWGAVPVGIFTNTSAQIRYRLTSSTQVYIVTNGWTDTRGRLG